MRTQPYESKTKRQNVRNRLLRDALLLFVAIFSLAYLVGFFLSSKIENRKVVDRFQHTEAVVSNYFSSDLSSCSSKSLTSFHGSKVSERTAQFILQDFSETERIEDGNCWYIPTSKGEIQVTVTTSSCLLPKKFEIFLDRHYDFSQSFQIVSLFGLDGKTEMEEIELLKMKLSESSTTESRTITMGRFIGLAHSVKDVGKCFKKFKITFKLTNDVCNDSVDDEDIPGGIPLCVYKASLYA